MFRTLPLTSAPLTGSFVSLIRLTGSSPGACAGVVPPPIRATTRFGVPLGWTWSLIHANCWPAASSGRWASAGSSPGALLRNTLWWCASSTVIAIGAPITGWAPVLRTSITTAAPFWSWSTVLPSTWMSRLTAPTRIPFWLNAAAPDAANFFAASTVDSQPQSAASAVTAVMTAERAGHPNVPAT